MPARFDLHCHTTRSDGTLRPEEVVEAAVSAELKAVGLVDHFHSTRLAAGAGISPSDLPAWIEEVRSLRARFRDRVKVLAGLEFTFSLLRTDFSFLSLQEAARNPASRLDFVLFEHVNEAEEFGLGLEELLKIRPLFTIPLGLAHNDLERNFGEILQPEVLAQIFAQQHMFIELSASGRHLRDEGEGRQRPWYRAESDFVRRFFAAARTNRVEFSVGSDAHDGAGEVGDVADPLAFLEELGLGESLVVRNHWGGV